MAVFEVAVDQVIAGSPRPVVNIFHVNAAQGMFVQGVAAVVNTAWKESILASMHSAVRAERVRVRSLDGISFSEQAIAQDGANPSAGVSPQVALLVRKVAPGLPRRRYGRMFFVGLAEADVDQGGNISQSTLNAWTTRLAAFLTSLDSAGCPMAQPWWTTTVQGKTFTETMNVTQLLPQSRVATQRRRVRG